MEWSLDCPGQDGRIQAHEKIMTDYSHNRFGLQDRRESPLDGYIGDWCTIAPYSLRIYVHIITIVRTSVHSPFNPVSQYSIFHTV